MKFIDPKEFRDKGYLVEVNRRVLHPLGLALAVMPDQELDEDGRFTVEVWDYRDDPEGFFFAEETFNASKEKIANVHRELQDKIEVRKESGIRGEVVNDAFIQT